MAVLLLAAAAAGAADDLRETGRALMEKQGGSIVTVKLVLKRRVVVQGQERGTSESQSEITGTVVSPTGLIVVSDSASNPWSMYASEDGPKVDTDTTDVKLLLEDGREVPARFVLRDHDLDLAFLQPEPSDLKLPYISLDGNRVPQPLDEILFLYREGKILNRQISVAAARVETVVKKPRTFVVSDWLTSTAGLGGPAFDTAGAPIGIVVLRRSPAAGDRMGNPMRILFDMFTPVILTLPDLKAVAEDAARAAAKTAKP
jgi:Trypsin-like peptidase domain